MSSTHTAKDDAPEMARTRFAKDQLKAFVERIERLEDEKKTIADDIRDIYAEAKGNGFDVKALRAIITLRKQPSHERAEHELILETYMNALGMLIGGGRDDDPPKGGSSGSSSKSGAGGGSTPKAGATHGASAASSDGEGPAPSTLAANYPASPSASRRGGPSPAPTDLACLASAAGELELGAPSSLPAPTQQGSGPPPVATEIPALSLVAEESEAEGRLSTSLQMGAVTGITAVPPPVIADDHPGIPPEFLIGHPKCWRGSATGPPEVRPP